MHFSPSLEVSIPIRQKWGGRHVHPFIDDPGGGNECTGIVAYELDIKFQRYNICCRLVDMRRKAQLSQKNRATLGVKKLMIVDDRPKFTVGYMTVDR